MMLVRSAFALLVLTGPAAAQGLGLLEETPDHLRLYTECMSLARSDPLKALPAAEKWHAQGGGFAARHCVATAMFIAGRYAQAAVQFEAIARDMGQDRPGLRAELWAQAGQAFLEAGSATKAIEAQNHAIELKPADASLWVDRGLSHAAQRSWPRAISDFDRALQLTPDDVEILVLRAASWRNAGNPERALADASRALKIAPDHSEALLERAFANLARGQRGTANVDFSLVLRLVPPGSPAARRAEAGLRGELPHPSEPALPQSSAATAKGGKR